MTSIRDDRGRSCGMLGLTAGAVALRGLGVPSIAGERTQRELATTGRLELAAAIIGGVLGGAGWQLAWMKWPVLGLPGLALGFVVVPVAAAAVAWAATLQPVRRHGFRRACRDHLATGHCPSCDFQLAGLTPEPDGCTGCPECGAAWRLDPSAT